MNLIPILCFLHVHTKNFTDTGLEYMMDVKKRMFDVPLTSEVGDYFCLNLAWGLASDCMKIFLVGLGLTNSG